MGSIEILIILAVRALNFTVMPRSIWFYEFMLYATLFEKLLKQRGHRLVRTAKTLCKLLTVVGLNTFNFEFERLEHMFKENG
mgnify:CR=1 FL=1